MEAQQDSLARFTRRALVFLLLVGLAVTLWQIARLLVLGFGGILLAVILHRLTGFLERHARLSYRAAYAAVLAVAVVLVIGLGWLFATQVGGQFDELWSTLRRSIDQLRADPGLLGGLLPSSGQGAGALFGDGMVSRITGWASSLLEILAGFLVVAFIGLYLAGDPGLYRRGVLLLVPEQHCPRAEQVLDAVGRSLWRWMVGQFLSMTLIFVLTTSVLWLVGVPLALPLGLIAGTLEFIPIIGPWLAAVPAVLVGLTVDVTTALWVALAYFVIQQVESYLITPMAERWAVALPPALTVAATVGFGLLFGFVGLLFATPISIALMVLVRMLYVRDTLGRQPGDSKMPG